MRFLALVPMLVLGCVAAAPALEMPPTPADQRWQIALDVKALLAGRLGKWIQRIAERDPAKARIAVFTGISGIDPLKDLALIGVGGVDARPEDMLLLVDGKLDAEKIATFLRSLPDYATATHRGHEVQSFAAAERVLAASFARTGATLVAAGGIPRAEAELDAFDAAAPTADPKRFPAVDLPAGSVPLLAAAATDIAAWKGLPPEAGPATAIQGLTIALAEKDGVLLLRARLNAVDVASGEKLASMVDGAVSALSLSDNARTDPALQALVDSVRLERHGTRVDLAAQLAVDLAERTWDPKLDTVMREKKADKAKPAK